MKKYILLLVAVSSAMIACNNPKTETTTDVMPAGENKQERNKRVIMTGMEIFAKGDFDSLFKSAAPGFVDLLDGTMPPVTNIDSLKEFMKMITTSIEGYKGENLQYYAEGDVVIVVGDWTGTFKNDLMGIKATGKPIRFKDADIFRLNEEGKITEHSSVQNIAAVLMTAGMTK